MINFFRHHHNTLLFLKVFLIVSIILCFKFLAHFYELEFLTINPLFSGILAANVFLMGFLMSGVLTDYKESERYPGKLACSLEIIIDEAESNYKEKKITNAKFLLIFTYKLAISITDWFFKKEKTVSILNKINLLTEHFSKLEKDIPLNYMVRLKQEQASIRENIIRIHTIRETNFIQSGYFISEVMSLLLITGLIFSKLEPLIDALFFTGVISFLMFFLLFLIKELDNPFSYYENGSLENVSIKPLQDLVVRFNKLDSKE